MFKVYLDACCLNRPFDDQSQDRVRLEAEAVLLILGHVERGQWQWISSDVVNYEIQQMPDPERRQRTTVLSRSASSVVSVDREVQDRGSKIAQMGFGSYDALHLAAAEQAHADVFLTTDDRLLRLARRMARDLRVQVDNPLAWLQKVGDP
jgi:predicted nucleic acid-binding protein